MSSSRYTRKDILVRGGAAAGGLSLAGLLAACGGGGDGGEAAPGPETATVTELTGEPVRGGRAVCRDHWCRHVGDAQSG